ncbi:hypothetical protein THAOC_01385, partial [Thalassiosira oceanica]
MCKSSDAGGSCQVLSHLSLAIDRWIIYLWLS